MSAHLTKRRAEAAADIAVRKERVATLRGMLAAERRERTNLKARLERKHKRHVADTKKWFEALDKAKAAAALAGKKLRLSGRMSTGGWAPIPFAHYDAAFQTKMHGIMREIEAAEAGVREAKAAREAMVV
jgi:hypothetical protein